MFPRFLSTIGIVLVPHQHFVGTFNVPNFEHLLNKPFVSLCFLIFSFIFSEVLIQIPKPCIQCLMARTRGSRNMFSRAGAILASPALLCTSLPVSRVWPLSIMQKFVVLGCRTVQDQERRRSFDGVLAQKSAARVIYSDLTSELEDWPRIEDVDNMESYNVKVRVFAPTCLLMHASGHICIWIC